MTLQTPVAGPRPIATEAESAGGLMLLVAKPLLCLHPSFRLSCISRQRPQSPDDVLSHLGLLVRCGAACSRLPVTQGYTVSPPYQPKYIDCNGTVCCDFMARMHGQQHYALLLIYSLAGVHVLQLCPPCTGIQMGISQYRCASTASAGVASVVFDSTA